MKIFKKKKISLSYTRAGRFAPGSLRSGRYRFYGEVNVPGELSSVYHLFYFFSPPGSLPLKMRWGKKRNKIRSFTLFTIIINLKKTANNLPRPPSPGPWLTVVVVGVGGIRPPSSSSSFALNQLHRDGRDQFVGGSVRKFSAGGEKLLVGNRAKERRWEGESEWERVSEKEGKSGGGYPVWRLIDIINSIAAAYTCIDTRFDVVNTRVRGCDRGAGAGGGGGGEGNVK